MKKLSDRLLENSSTVANSLMNRERACLGGNSYQKELCLDIPEYLKTRLPAEKQAAWLDLCCGSGKALIEAANVLAAQNLSSKMKIIGVDLVSMFDSFPPELDCLHLIESSAAAFRPDCGFDLITCVHGLHYIGNKLAFLQKAVSLLKADGIFLANLDLANFKYADGKPAGRAVAKEFRKFGFEYQSKKHLLARKGRAEINFKFQYLGADDEAGPNYTGQRAVDSFYAY